MGNHSSTEEPSFWKTSIQRRRNRSVMVVGLDNAGKSSILSWMDKTIQKTLERDQQALNYVIAPTTGLRRCEFISNAIAYTIWDMSGQGRYRNLWHYYYQHVHGIVFVVDSTDIDRIAAARDEFFMLIEHPGIKTKKIPLLLFLNKTEVSQGNQDEETEPAEDQISNLNVKSIQQLFQLDKLPSGYPWKIQPCSGVTGYGVDQGKFAML